MIIFIDLDGTLTDTASVKYKALKDGLEDFSARDIPVFNGAIDFVSHQKKIGNTIIILSDSHPKYVAKIAKEIFDLDYIYLADKPNTSRLLQYIESHPDIKAVFGVKSEFLIIGDSALDIQLGRKLQIPTVLTRFYKFTDADEYDDADLIGDERLLIKYGPTYSAKSFQRVSAIIDDRLGNLLAIEAIDKDKNSCEVVRFWDYKRQDRVVAFRCLARQENGACDQFARADLYFQIDNPNRGQEVLQKLAGGASNYIANACSHSGYHWDYITYVSDKRTTIPPNKMKEIFDLIHTDVEKIKLFEWDDSVSTSLRAEKDYGRRQSFIREHLSVSQDVDVVGKNIIIIDDQLTTGATAFEIRKKLESLNVGNILFIALFYMILEVKDDRTCPRCGKPMSIKTNRREGNKFYSCVGVQYGGDGCGYIENIK